jgi:hypothetical protein
MAIQPVAGGWHRTIAAGLLFLDLPTAFWLQHADHFLDSLFEAGPTDFSRCRQCPFGTPP